MGDTALRQELAGRIERTYAAAKGAPGYAACNPAANLWEEFYDLLECNVEHIVTALRSTPAPSPMVTEEELRAFGDVLVLGDKIHRLIDQIFHDTNQTAASELKQLLWDNKVGICRLLQHLSSALLRERRERCPKCNSPNPGLHPAIQHEGEVQMCRDPWHAPVVDDERNSATKGD